MKPYSNDLRQCVVEAYENKKGSYRRLADIFMVSLSFIQDIIKLYRQTGSVVPKPHSGGVSPKISGNGLETVRKLCEKTPDATLKELCLQFYGITDITVSQSVMHNALKKLDLTRKKNFQSGGTGQRGCKKSP